MTRERQMKTVLFLLAGFLSYTHCQIVVGGNYGWRPSVNYSTWASSHTVHVGDWLLFRFDKYMYDVVEVTETSFEKCDGQNFIKNITRGGRDVYQVTEARPYYFICTKGYCFGGMKVAINVTDREMTPPPPPPPHISGSTSYAKVTLSSVILIASCVVGILHM